MLELKPTVVFSNELLLIGQNTGIRIEMPNEANYGPGDDLFQINLIACLLEQIYIVQTGYDDAPPDAVLQYVYVGYWLEKRRSSYVLLLYVFILSAMLYILCEHAQC